MSIQIRTLKDSDGNIFYPLTTSEAVANGLIVDLTDVTSGATYATLSSALLALPEMYRKAGMELRYVQSTDGKYVYYRYMETTTTGNPNPFLNTDNWQGVDDIPLEDSKNLVTSGGVFEECVEADQIVGDPVGDWVESDAQAYVDARINEVKGGASYNFNTLKKLQDAYTSLDGGKFVTVQTYASLPVTGREDTVYRVSNYDGTAVDASKYAEYSWNGTGYVLLAVRSQIGEVFDISEYNNTTYANLAAALSGDNVPTSVRKGGMSVKFVLSSDNKYVQYRLKSTNFSTDTEDWEQSTTGLTVPLITWSALKALRDGGNLVAGQSYRITDYVTTTVQNETQSAGHQFDIIVTADSANVLNENAYATIHSGDTYFANSKLESWELKYCLNNDVDRFAWADEENGKGVIYWMKDEFFNECGYDFKNIMFARYKITAMDKVPNLVNKYSGFRAVTTSGQGSLYPYGATIDSSDKVYRYTFDYEGTDYSLTPRSYKGCHENVIAPYKPSDNQADRERQFLNNITFANTYTTAQCYGNKFKSRCHSMVFGNDCRSNTFGSNCYSNVFGANCYSNVFGTNCYSNTFGNSCSYNTFDIYCTSNTFGNSCSYNTFGSSCYYNTFDNDCSSNTFGNSCYSNTFGIGCSNNTFDIYCTSNTFGNSCSYNTFSNSCSSNTFGNYCSSNTFDKSYTKFIIIENGNMSIFLTSTETTSDLMMLQNIKIEQGVNNSYTRLDISHNTLNDKFQTVYRAQESQDVYLKSQGYY